MRRVERCAHCAAPLKREEGPASEIRWCSAACMRAWDVANPEEAAKWIPVDRLTPEQMAILMADLGLGEPC